VSATKARQQLIFGQMGRAVTADGAAPIGDRLSRRLFRAYEVLGQSTSISYLTEAISFVAFFQSSAEIVRLWEIPRLSICHG
jgi:hypothetical protein